MGGVGDSYTVGEGAGMGRYRPTITGAEEFRHQTAYSQVHLSWLYLMAKRRPIGTPYTVDSPRLEFDWGGDRFEFAASSGARTEHLKNTEQMDPDTGMLRNWKQLDGIDRLSDLIYFGFGGNDAQYSDVFKVAIEWLLVGTLEDIVQPRPRPPGYENLGRRLQTEAVRLKVDEMLALMPQVTANIYTSLIQTWEWAPNARIAVMLYPDGVKPTGNADIPFVYGTALDQIARFGLALNAAIREGVARFARDYPAAPEPRIFDPNTAGPNGSSVIAGHELGQQNSYFNGLVIHTDEFQKGHRLHATQESFHYNQFGTVAVGKALATWTAQQYPDLFPGGPDFDAVITDPKAYALSDYLVGQRLENWLNLNLAQLCAFSRGGALCDPPGSGGSDSVGNPLTEPPIGRDPGDPGWFMEGYLYGVYIGVGGTGHTTGGGWPNSNPGNPGTGFSEYVQDPSGAWFEMRTNASGQLEIIPLPNGPPCDPNPGAAAGCSRRSRRARCGRPGSRSSPNRRLSMVDARDGRRRGGVAAASILAIVAAALVVPGPAAGADAARPAGPRRCSTCPTPPCRAATSWS
ncbi:hypothetical protein [Phytohabitans rumicis]|uniref:Uncharacterized protein n=1 Tax=Phytohabitans rumicis TaxID=1076125 RepID=A0A6V8LGY9_9ACTN|nr:hypothetical protein [Phytohabitans rumicis]GFJ95514.1 hypothetical protein Prum_091560 [Phytohabitans rumicis]